MTSLRLPTKAAAKPPKYRNKIVVVDGLKFDSKREAARWQELKLLQSAGKIRNLVRQVEFKLAPAVSIKGRKRPALKYIADFAYDDGPQWVIEDVKGKVTEGYRIKRHLMAVMGFQILETK